MNNNTAKGYDEAHHLSLENAAYPTYEIERQTRVYQIGKGNGPFGAKAFGEALERATEAEPIPTSDLVGDCWDAAALTITWLEKRDTPFQIALAQLAREMTVVAGRAEAANAGEVFLKLMLLGRWLEQPKLPFATEISSFLAQMVMRDCDLLGLDPEPIRADAERHFPALCT